MGVRVFAPFPVTRVLLSLFSGCSGIPHVLRCAIFLLYTIYVKVLDDANKFEQFQTLTFDSEVKSEM